MWSPKVKTIDALERGLVTLTALRELGAASLHDLHLHTGIPKATLLRILLTLERQGMIWKRLADGRFRPSYTLQTHTRPPDHADRLIECAVAELDRLQRRVLWPSDVAVRRDTAMMLCESNRAHSYFMVNRNKLGYEINMLRSAVGRAYLAFCPARERAQILKKLRQRPRPGDEIASDEQSVERLLDETRRLGYGTRESSFGGAYDKPRSEYHDGLAAIAVPIRALDGSVAGCLNLVWIERLFNVGEMADRHLKDLQETALRIAARLERA